MEIVAGQFASRLSMIAFATATMRGFISGTDFRTSIQMALVSMVVFYVVGRLIGELARRLVEDSLDAELAKMIAAREEADS